MNKFQIIQGLIRLLLLSFVDAETWDVLNHIKAEGLIYSL